MQYPYHPNGRGFDEYYGFCSGHWGDYFSPPFEHNGRLVRGEGFCIDDFTNHAIEFMADADKAGEPCGYVIWREWTPDDPEVRVATVLDIWDGDDPALSQSLLDGARRFAVRSGCAFLQFSVLPGRAHDDGAIVVDTAERRYGAARLAIADPQAWVKRIEAIG